MIYRICPDLFAQYPYFYRGVIVASHLDNTGSNNAGLEELLRARIREIEGDESVSIDHQRVRAWYDIYKAFPIKDARKLQPSVGALVKRIKSGRGKDIPFISPLVCISNLISLTHLVPSGLIDAARVEGNLVLGFADGSERFEAIGGNE